jgi:hypothetical protein
MPIAWKGTVVLYAGRGGGRSPRQAADDMSATARKRTTFG